MRRTEDEYAHTKREAAKDLRAVSDRVSPGARELIQQEVTEALGAILAARCTSEYPRDATYIGT